MMKTGHFIFFILLIPLFTLSAGNPLGLQQPSSPATVPYWLQIDNDSLGLEINGEWDDKSSFGFKGGAGFLDGRLQSALSLTGYTDRGNEDEASSRYDKIDLGFSWQPEDVSFGGWALAMVPGGGALLLGDLGGYEIQYHWHELVSVERPIPDKDSYVEAQSGTADVEGYGFTELQLTPLSLSWLHMDAALRMETTGWLFCNIGFSAGVEKREKAQLLSLLYQNDLLSFEESPFPPTALRDDVRIALDLRAGGLYVHKAAYLLNEISEGSIGYLFGGDSGDPAARGMTERMDIGTSAFLNGPLVRWAWALNSPGRDRPDPGRCWMLLQYQSGWRVMDGKYEDKAKRFSSLGFGFEYQLLLKPLPLLIPYTAFTAGLSDFRKLDAGLKEAETRENEIFFHLIPLLGLRIDLPSKKAPFTYSFALEGGVMFKMNDDPGLHPAVNFIAGCRLH